MPGADPAREVEYRLEFLPQTDAFYTFKGALGERRLLPGRSGPPGADYNTLPAFKPKARQMIAFHWTEDDGLYLDSYRSMRQDFGTFAPIAARFHAAWRCAGTIEIKTC